jgi:RsiW-degrading membrane proteinase PrsW (M82 family)
MLILVAAAVLPALILLWLVYSRDSQKEPGEMIFKGFCYGALSTLVSLFISVPLSMLGLDVENPTTVVDALKTSFFGAAIPEESAKLLMLWLLLRNNKYFDEEYDGLVYSASVGLGFAALENILYVAGQGAGWMTVAVSRALLAVPGHFAFAIMMGYYYSVWHFERENAPKGTKAKILLVPILLHGTYDFICFITEINELWSGILTIVLLIFCYFLFKSTKATIQRQAEKNDERNKIMRDSAPEDDAPDEQ